MPDRHRLTDWIGKSVGSSQWYALDQSRIDAFADVTEDRQFIHTDPARAGDGPFGTTIAHGFLTLSMLSVMLADLDWPIEGEVMAVNYGFDRIRFVSPVPSGARVRAVFVLSDVTDRGPDAVDTAFDVTIEIEGSDRPALAARWINRRYIANL